MSRTTGSLTISQSLFDDVKKHYDELVKLNNWVDTIPPVTQMSTYEQLIVRTYRLLLIFIHGSVLDSLDYITEEMIFILRNSFESLLQNVDWGPVCTKMILILCSVAESSNSEKTLLALLTINLESLKYSFYDEITRKKLVDTSIVIKRKLALAYQSLLPNVSTPNHPKTLSSSSKPAPPTSQNGVAPLLEELSGEPEVSTKCMKKPVSQSPILSSVYIPKSNYIPFVRKHELHYLLEIPFDISKEDMLLLKQRPKENQPQYKLFLFFTQDTPNSSDPYDYLEKCAYPSELFVQINGVHVPIGDSCKSPVEVTNFIKEPNNVLSVVMLSDRYFTSLCLFKVQTVRQILSSVTVRPKSECMQFLSTRKFDIPTHVYLRNAGKTDTNLAARSNRCEHFECFELGSFLLTSSTSSPWKCPVCDCLINDESCLYIDQLFTETSLEAQQKTAFGAQ